MVQSSIVIPTNNFMTSNKRKADEEVRNIKVEKNEEEQPKKPRLEDNEAGRRRNKRLFGVLLGTLNKFKDDTEQTSEVDKKRREINQKLQDKLDLEKKALVEKMEARKLEKERLEQMKREEEEKIIAEKKDLFEIQQKRIMAKFLKTTTKPTLYYLPDKLTDKMSQTLDTQTQDAFSAKISSENRREGRRETRTEDPREEDRLSDNDD
ncbi:hypothetical protein G6F56_003036 [Rhizopus delemar]|nr:hypothetical protein G6F56_003036 [Rhizopus delemar]